MPLLIRRVLALFLAVFLLAFPFQAYNASSDSLPAVNSLPRFALVIGNSHYKETPLKNPGNDANAIAERLRGMGFIVTLKLDADRKEMIETIRSFGSDLLKQKGVGVFYFAGHGAQLSWRNYLIPVDASISKITDIEKQAVDVSTLLDSLTRARNPMNVIILDACRDNPFGDDIHFEQKGLSQLDAPPGTLLAYATSPGNVAADGVGVNGLYTQFLLKEMDTREAKLEDVFKRVRLNVRRQSRGQQIPWESTSLEEDFYFFPPKQIRKLTEDELEKQFEEELGIWEKIKTSKDLATLEGYLVRFPSGKFSELAQFRLDRVLAQTGEKPVQIASIAPVPIPIAQAPAKPDPAIAAAERKRQDELARAEAELKKQQELAKAEAVRKQQEEIARAEAERKRQDALARAEAEQKRLEDLARAEAERRRKEDLARAEAERKRQAELALAQAEFRKQQELAKAEADRKRQDELARAEAALRKQQELAKAEAELKQQEELARAEAERKRQGALAQAEADRKRLEELARVEDVRRKKEDLARAEAERKRQEELARTEAEVTKQRELAKAEADRKRQVAIAQAEPATAAPIAPIQVASIGPNPFSRGTAKVDLDFKTGDMYSYRVINTLTNVESRQFAGKITAVTDDEVIYGNGRLVTDLLGNIIKTPNGNKFAGQQFYVAEYSIGKKWTTRYRLTRPDGVNLDTHVDFKVIAKEQVTVQAGTFDAFKVEGRGFNVRGSDLHFIYWIAPEQARRPIVLIIDTHNKGGKVISSDRHELIAYRQGGTIKGDPGAMSDAACDDCQPAPRQEQEKGGSGNATSVPEREKGEGETARPESGREKGGFGKGRRR